MRKLYYFFSLFLFLSINFTYSQTFSRIDSILVPSIENTGFGEFIAGVDFDGDGNAEIYAVNNMLDQGGPELIPRIYKFEFNGSSWDSVWSAETNIPMQNSWAALTYGDWDNDGRMEIIWGPVNNLDASNPNPPRILVYEYAGDGSDNMGVDAFGTFFPNAQWTIIDQENFNLRPIRWLLNDIDSDGNLELIFADRAVTYFYGVVSVSDIPNDGDGSETWTLEASGQGSTINLSTIYDLAIVDSTIYLFHDGGTVTPVQYNSGTYTVESEIPNAVPGGSWKSAQVLDIDNDGSQEIILGGWLTGNNKVYLLRKTPSGLTTTQIANASSLIGSTGRFNGSSAGDIDQNGMLDFVFGTRQAVPNGSIVRLEYLGGDIADSNSYNLSVIDSLYPSATNVNRFDVVKIANINADNELEVLYTDGNQIGRIPIIILDYQGATFIKENYIPNEFYLDQNYPNPFNPSTTIKFGLNYPANISLKIFNSLGEETAVLINNEYLSPGSYAVNFSGKELASGIYIYMLQAGERILSRKMILLK